MIVLFDDFKDDQFVAYYLLLNSIRNNKVSHAYLIDGNYNENAFDFVMSFIKVILCDSHYTNYNNCGNCNKCMRIDNGNYPEVKVISSDSLVIKKEQLLELQNTFSRTSIEGKNKIYVIKDCDKMNKQASNSLLKFLEEPGEGIIAILLTNNVNKVLSTIVSRCQLIKLSKRKFVNGCDTITNFAYSYCSSKNEVDEFLLDQSKKDIISGVLDFIDYYEENGLDTIIYLKKLWYNKFSTRNDSIYSLFLMINFYYDVFKFLFDIGDYFFCDYIEKIEVISKLNNVDSILKKIDVCIEAKKFLECNLNVNLVIDNFVIKLGE